MFSKKKLYFKINIILMLFILFIYFCQFSLYTVECCFACYLPFTALFKSCVSTCFSLGDILFLLVTVAGNAKFESLI